MAKLLRLVLRVFIELQVLQHLLLGQEHELVSNFYGELSCGVGLGIHLFVEALRLVLVRDLTPSDDKIFVVWIVFVTDGAHDESVECEDHVKVNFGY